MTFYLKTIFFLKLFVSVGTLFCYKQYITWKWLKVQFLWLPSSSLSNDIGYKSFHLKTFLVEQKNLKTLQPLFVDGVQLPQGHSHFEEAVYFLLLSSQKFLVLILSTSEGWKTESNLEQPSGFEHGTLGLGIQSINH